MLLGASAVAVAVLIGVAVWALSRPGQSTAAPTASPAASQSASPSASAPPSPTPSPTPSYNIDDPASLQVVVNKLRPINPPEFTPPDLRAVNVAHTWEPQLRDAAATAVESMFAAARDEAGLALASNSAYRSYSAQARIYDGNDALTARPGYSEHQTGLAIDIGAESGRCSLSACFADTAEGQWLAANAYRFGFVLRYPNGATGITGYDFEPWHYRYVGTEVATAMRDRGVGTLEEFFGLPPAPSY